MTFYNDEDFGRFFTKLFKVVVAQTGIFGDLNKIYNPKEKEVK